MSIDLRSIGASPKASPPKQSSAGATGQHFAETQPVKPESDALHFTDAGAILQNAERLVAALPVVDSSRVSRINSSIDQGSYIVNAERVAEKIIEFEQGLAG